MIKIIFSVLLLISTQAFAEDLLCVVSRNTEQISQQKISVLKNTTALYFDLHPYQFKIKNNGEAQFEIEIYDRETPSRSYITGFLHSPSDEVKWLLWNREILLETSCRLIE